MLFLDYYLLQMRSWSTFSADVNNYQVSYYCIRAYLKCLIATQLFTNSIENNCTTQRKVIFVREVSNAWFVNILLLFFFFQNHHIGFLCKNI